MILRNCLPGFATKIIKGKKFYLYVKNMPKLERTTTGSRSKHPSPVKRAKQRMSL